jgi:peptide-methionine (S)-S-oxide reductase
MIGAMSLSLNDERKPALVPEVPPGAEVITLGSGCFWCTEAVFDRVAGVLAVTSGYMGGHVENPTYEQICDADTGHAEVTRIVYDPVKAPLSKLLDVFWKSHDPTTPDRQGADVGPQYRSAIFYETDAQRDIAEKSKAAAQPKFSDPIVTEITKAGRFYPAERYHQDYYQRNKTRNPYCHVVIAPKLGKLGMDT